MLPTSWVTVHFVACVCVWHACALLCVGSVVTQPYGRDSLDLILAAILILNLIRVVRLLCLITLIYLVSVRLQLVQDVTVIVIEQSNFVWLELHCVNLVLSNYSIFEWQAAVQQVWVSDSPEERWLKPTVLRVCNPWSVSLSFTQGTLKISLPYSPTKTLSVKSILRWEV